MRKKVVDIFENNEADFLIINRSRVVEDDGGGGNDYWKWELSSKYPGFNYPWLISRSYNIATKAGRITI